MPRKQAQAEPVRPPEPVAPAPSGHDIEPLLRELSQRMLDALNRNTAAILAAGIMASRGRPHTPEEALRLHQEMINTIWPKGPGPARAEESVPA
ncbi:MAG: hypothetical protein M0002_15495 [Rhodospirillales bacterium]|nr:hypothetical protein [Rhodospirillales bacterium]